MSPPKRRGLSYCNLRSRELKICCCCLLTEGCKKVYQWIRSLTLERISLNNQLISVIRLKTRRCLPPCLRISCSCFYVSHIVDERTAASCGSGAVAEWRPGVGCCAGPGLIVAVVVTRRSGTDVTSSSCPSTGGSRGSGSRNLDLKRPRRASWARD